MVLEVANLPDVVVDVVNLRNVIVDVVMIRVVIVVVENRGATLNTVIHTESMNHAAHVNVICVMIDSRVHPV